MIEIALYEPDIAPNAATILRLAACLGLTVRIIEPAGFAWSEAAFRRAGLDYLSKAKVVRDASWGAFLDATAGRRRILMSTKAAQPYCDFAFATGDIILMGREIGRRSRPCSCERRCPAAHPDAAGLALAQCGARLRHGDRRGDAAAQRLSAIEHLLSLATSMLSLHT